MNSKFYRLNALLIGKFAIGALFLVFGFKVIAAPDYWYPDTNDDGFEATAQDFQGLCDQYMLFIRQKNQGRPEYSDPSKWYGGRNDCNGSGGYCCKVGYRGSEVLSATWVVGVKHGGCDFGYAPTPGAPDRFSNDDGYSKGYCAKAAHIFRHGPARNACEPRQGNPIYPLSGAKIQSIDTGIELGSRKFIFTYNSVRALRAPDQSPLRGDLGVAWFSNFHPRWRMDPTVTTAQLDRGDGAYASFDLPASKLGTDVWSSPFDFVTPPGGRDSLKYLGNSNYLNVGSASLYKDQNALTYYLFGGIYISHEDGPNKIFDSRGRSISFTSTRNSPYVTPVSIAPNGRVYLLSAVDDFGRNISFTYKIPPGFPAGTQGYIASITDSDGQVHTVDYDASGNLISFAWPDGSVRNFMYESPHSGQSWALTGVRDERANAEGRSTAFATFSYNPKGWAVSTEHAGGVDRYSVNYLNDAGPEQVWTDSYDASLQRIFRYYSWSAPQGFSVTRPNGSVETFNPPSGVLNYPRDTGRQQPGGSGCGASSSVIDYDGNGNVKLVDDFNGNRTCKSNDLARNLELVKVEGLAGGTGGADCAGVLGSSATLPVGARKISTAWHPDWNVPTQVAEPLKITTSVYNGQPDPTSGNQVLTCAPTNALLPDGKPILVLCKKVVQATSDANGSLGAGAAVRSDVPARTWTYTYTRYGQVLTSVDPLGRQTQYTYYVDTTPAHTTGDLQSVVNAAGHTTQYTKYTKSGRLLEMIDPNGLTTSMTYYPRGWVKSVSVSTSDAGVSTTSYQYFANGLLKSVTQPDTTTVSFDYDDAQRLISATDAAGNSVTYSLDASGNRVGEQVKDSSGRLAKNVTRIFDALDRLQTSIGAPN